MGAEEIKAVFATDEKTDSTSLKIKVAELAKLEWLEYLAERRTAVAKQFAIPKGELDKLVKAEQREQKAQAERIAYEAAQAKAAEGPTVAEVARLAAEEAAQITARKESEEAAAAELYKTAKPIAETDIIAEVHKQLKADGYAGDTASAQRSYITISSRVLARPINLFKQAQPASGKNHSTDAVLPYFPGDAFYKITAGSEKALIYETRSFKNVTVIVDEMDSLPADGAAASAVRSIVNDGQMIYVVVERNPETQQHESRTIIKEGPTGLITTGTKALEPQMATRVLTDTLRDDAAQTRLIMRSQAKKAQGEIEPVLTAYEPLVAFQKWLALKGERRIVVPFALVLSDMIPADPVRMRRDHKQILCAIETSALISQMRRERDDKGRVIASLEDYRIARELLAPLIDVIVTDGVTAAVRETVEAFINEIEEVSLSELMKRLKRSKAAASYRSLRAIEGGYLVNEEKRDGHPARLRRTSLPLPEKESALPTVERLEKEIKKREAEIDRLAAADAEE